MTRNAADDLAVVRSILERIRDTGECGRDVPRALDALARVEAHVAELARAGLDIERAAVPVRRLLGLNTGGATP